MVHIIPFRLVLATLILCNGLTASLAVTQPGPKSAGAATQREQIASLLREAASLMQAGKLDEAEPLVRRVVAIPPSNADAHNLPGVILDHPGRTDAPSPAHFYAFRSNPPAPY